MITIDSLTKKYGANAVVHDVTFTARPGRVTGFLGPNGAGKSTTMRMIMGLDTPTAGTVTVNGVPFARHTAPLREIGALLDAKAVHTSRSAYNHLLAMAATHSIPRKRVHEVIDMTGLADVARKKVKGFSLGMGQRLGIAAALIGDPQVLILDEPANGLDPAGIRWMRDLLRDYANRGGTVLLSSHLLSEIEIIADDIVMIGQGRIVSQGSKVDLLAAAGTVVRSEDIPALEKALAAAGVRTTVCEDGSLRTETDAAQVGGVAYRAGVMLTELRSADSGGLEEMFLELTADTQRERTAA